MPSIAIPSPGEVLFDLDNRNDILVSLAPDSQYTCPVLVNLMAGQEYIFTPANSRNGLALWEVGGGRV